MGLASGLAGRFAETEAARLAEARLVEQAVARQAASRATETIALREAERLAVDRIAVQAAERQATERIAAQAGAAAAERRAAELAAGRTVERGALRKGVGKAAGFIERHPVIAGTGLILGGSFVLDQVNQAIHPAPKFPDLPSGDNGLGDLLDKLNKLGTGPGPNGAPQLPAGPSFDTSGILGNITAGVGSAIDRVGGAIEAFAQGVGVPLGQGAGKAVAIGGTLLLGAFAVAKVLPAIAGSASSAGAGAAKAGASAAKASAKGTAKAARGAVRAKVA